MPQIKAKCGQPPAKRPTPSPRYEQQRRRIIDEATVLLNQKGVAGLTLQDVAHQLGLKATAVTYYFRYKEQLVVAVFAQSLAKLANMAATATGERDPHMRVNRYLALHFEHHSKVRLGVECPFAVFSEIRALENDARVELIEQYKDIFRTVRGFFGTFDTDRQKLAFSARAQTLNEAIFWSAIWLNNYESEDFALVQRQLFQIFANGIMDGQRPSTTYRLNRATPSEDADSQAVFLRTATRLLNEIGYRGTSIDRIAADASLSRGSFYHKRETKDELILECFRNSHARFMGLYRAAFATGMSKAAILLHVIANAIDIQLDGQYPLLRTTAFQALPAALRSIPYEHSLRSALLLTALMVDAWQESGTCPVNPTLASHVIMSTINSAFDMRSWARKQDARQAVDTYLAILTRGIFTD